MIETKAYRLTQETFTNIVMRRLFVKKWWFFMAFFLLICFHINFKGLYKFDSFWSYLLIGYPLFYIGYTFFWSRSKSHKDFLAETNLEFDKVSMLFKKNENEVKIPYKNIKRLETYDQYWLLYISKRNFIYVPKDIFYTKEDLHTFKTYIKA